MPESASSAVVVLGGEGVLDARAEASQGSREEHGHDDERGRQGQEDDQQRGAQQEEDDDGAHEAERRREQRGQRVRQHHAHLGDVAREARDELADPPLDVEVELERDEALEDLVAEAGHDALAHDPEGPGLDQRRSRPARA